ncbi:MAG: glycoside hydrolase, partial [uncultured Thermomicrobiales bacterium]
GMCARDRIAAGADHGPAPNPRRKPDRGHVHHDQPPPTDPTHPTARSDRDVLATAPPPGLRRWDLRRHARHASAGRRRPARRPRRPPVRPEPGRRQGGLLQPARRRPRRGTDAAARSGRADGVERPRHRRQGGRRRLLRDRGPPLPRRGDLLPGPRRDGPRRGAARARRLRHRPPRYLQGLRPRLRTARPGRPRRGDRRALARLRRRLLAEPLRGRGPGELDRPRRGTGRPRLRRGPVRLRPLPLGRRPGAGRLRPGGPGRGEDRHDRRVPRRGSRGAGAARGTNRRRRLRLHPPPGGHRHRPERGPHRRGDRRRLPDGLPLPLPRGEHRRCRPPERLPGRDDPDQHGGRRRPPRRRRRPTPPLAPGLLARGPRRVRPCRRPRPDRRRRGRRHRRLDDLERRQRLPGNGVRPRRV